MRKSIFRVSVYAIIYIAALVGMGLPTLSWAQATTHSPTELIPASYFGMHIHRADRGTKWPGREIGAWRLWDANVVWLDIEPQPGVWDFSRLDRYVSMAASTGTEIDYPLAMSPPWASARPEEKGVYSKTKKGDAAEPAKLEDWEDMVRTVVRRYKGRIRSYELWNEVNTGTGFYSGTPEALLALQKSAYRIIKQEDPAALFVSPSVVGESDQQLGWFDKYLGLGAGNYADVIGYHMYVPRKPPEEIAGLVQKLRRIMVRHGIADKPLWNTESGYRMDFRQERVVAADPSWPALSPERAEAYVVRALLLGWWAGIDRFYWYAWDNSDLGLIDPAGNVTAAGKAYLTTVRWLVGSSLKSCKRTGPVWVCAIERRGRNAWLVWNEGNDEMPWSVVSLPTVTAWEALSGKTGAIDKTQTVKLDGRPLLLLDSNIAWSEKIK